MTAIQHVILSKDTDGQLTIRQDWFRFERSGGEEKVVADIGGYQFEGKNLTLALESARRKGHLPLHHSLAEEAYCFLCRIGKTYPVFLDPKKRWVHAHLNRINFGKLRLSNKRRGL